MKLEVGVQFRAAHGRHAQYLGHLFVATCAAITDGKQEGNIGVVGAGEGVIHEHIGVGVVQADALVVPDFPRHGV